MTRIGDRLETLKAEQEKARQLADSWKAVEEGRKKEADAKFEKWVGSLTWWKLFKYTVKTVLALMLVLVVGGLIFGVPCWLLYKLFFVVLP